MMIFQNILMFFAFNVAGAQKLSGNMGTVSPCNRCCGEYTNKCATLQQSMESGHLTECTILHNDKQLWFSCTTMSRSEKNRNTFDQCFERRAQELRLGSEQFHDCCLCHSVGIITAGMGDTFKMSVKESESAFGIHQGDCEVFMEHQCSGSVSLSISDCTFNQSGKLVRMTVSFDEFDSGASCSSSGDDSNLEDESYLSDCEEDFIIFDSDSDGFHISSNCVETPSFNLCNSANPNAGEHCWETKSDVEENLAAFVRGINEPLYYKTSKGFKIGNNNVPVMWSSPNRPCRGQENKLQNDSPGLNCETSKVTLNQCQGRQAKTKPTKCVQFKQESELVETHSIIAWDFAYRQARIGPWERVAVDRLRFQKRIQELEIILAPVLLRQQLKSKQQYLGSLWNI